MECPNCARRYCVCGIEFMNAGATGRIPSKPKHRTIKVWRIGNFYEAFGDDAKLLAVVTGLTLTTRPNGTLLAGFPIHDIHASTEKCLRASIKLKVVKGKCPHV